MCWVQGSSTACIAVLKDDQLHVANLGDSGVWLVRAGKVVFATTQQQHQFNCPYQISCDAKASDPPTAAQVLYSQDL